MPSMEMRHEAEPASAILNDLAGHQDKVTLFGANVLVAIYKRPEQTKGGIILPGKTREEDLYQGKVGLVVATGPLAFQEDAARGVVFPERAKVGDWVLLRGSDSWQLNVNKVDCRMCSDVAIRGVVEHPDMVY